MLVGKTQVFSFALGLVTAASIGVAYICLRGPNSLADAFKPARLAQNTFALSEHTIGNVTTTISIPHVLHQSWINATVPHRFDAWRKSWVTHHPKWEFRMWTDTDNDALVQEQFPWFLSRYKTYEEAVMRADSVRYMYLYRYGGVYADLDFESLKSLEPLLPRGKVLLGTLGVNSPPEHSIPNSFMASMPGHPFWVFCLAKMLSVHVSREAGSYVERMTGPIMLKQALDEYNAQRDNKEADADVTVLPQPLLYPIVWSDPATHHADCSWGAANFSEQACHSHFEDAYAVTYWAHGWR